MAYSMLGHNETQMDSYNKNTPSAHGTLIANWYEERVHRDEKGNGRAFTKTHLPKKHEDLHTSDKLFAPSGADDTKYRVLGDTTYALGKSENYHYGKGRNKAEEFPKTGRKQQLIEQMYLQEVRATIEEDERARAEEARRGSFETTHKTTFVPKPLNQNVIGKLVMYDQDGKTVQLSNCDEDLRQSLGLKMRGQISSDQELRKLIDTNEGYERQQPITFWKEKVEEGTFYHSKAGAQPFAKNNEFCKTFQNYKHYHD